MEGPQSGGITEVVGYSFEFLVSTKRRIPLSLGVMVMLHFSPKHATMDLTSRSPRAGIFH